jgi:hypothetical protein
MSFLQRFLNLRSARPGGLILGQYGPGWLLTCRLPLDEFDTHMYVVGKTKVTVQVVGGGRSDGAAAPRILAAHAAVR